MRIWMICLVAMAAGILGTGVAGADVAGRPKIYGIAYVKVKVTDVEKAKAFYGGVLGLASSGVDSCKGIANPCFVVNPYQHVELVKVGAGETGTFLAEIGLTTSDLNLMRAYLTSKGIAASEILRGVNGFAVVRGD